MTKIQQVTRNQVIDLLIKKASGFYYTEEQFEYEKTQNKSNFKENCSNFNNFSPNFDTVKQLSFINNDNIKSSDENNKTQNKNTEQLSLVKKKVTTHYISPDMLAIKILLEICEEKVGDNFESLTDSELINLKNKLIGELINEDISNNVSN